MIRTITPNDLDDAITAHQSEQPLKIEDMKDAILLALEELKERREHDDAIRDAANTLDELIGVFP